jgi:hypothetical protein
MRKSAIDTALAAVPLALLILSSTGCNLVGGIDKPKSRAEILDSARIKIGDGDCGGAITDITNLGTADDESNHYLGYAQLCVGGATFAKIAAAGLSFDKNATNNLSILGTVANGLIPQTDASILNIQAAANTFQKIQNSTMKDFDSAIANIAWASSYIAKAATLASASATARSQIGAGGCLNQNCTANPAACSGANMNNNDAASLQAALLNIGTATASETSFGKLSDLGSKLTADVAAFSGANVANDTRCYVFNNILTQ